MKTRNLKRNSKQPRTLLLLLAVFALGILIYSNKFSQIPSVHGQTTGSITFTTSQTGGEDTYIDSQNSSTNYGSETSLHLDNSPVQKGLLRFNVNGLPQGATVTNARLRLYVTNYSAVSGVVSSVNGSWSESITTWSNAPSVGSSIGNFSNPATVGTWVEGNVTPATTGNSTVDFYITSTSSDGVWYNSGEAASNPPTLIVDYTATDGTPTPTPPPVSTPTPIPTATPTPTSTPTPINTPTSTPPAPTPIGSDPTVMAAGDIICNSLSTTSSSCQQMAASQVAVDQNPNAVLILGDLCHTPSANCFNNYYNPSWGRLFSKSYPTTGNHEYLVTGAVYYFDYWNGVGSADGRAGNRSKGYYSYDIGSWHIIALNSQCSQAGGCNTGSPQYTWLQQDLQNHPNKCTLAYYHIPLFSSGGRANNNMKQIYTLLYNNNADVILNGHDHIYERFAPQDPSGQADVPRGIREFIVGTGGSNHTSIATIKPNSEVRNTDTFGALKFTLRPDSYDWQFMPVAGKTFTDSGTASCH